MNELIAKLTDLGYEFFGVLLPGLVASVWILVCLVALGPIAPIVTLNLVPELSWGKVWAFLGTLRLDGGLRTVIPTLMTWWFLGQVILAISRRGKKDKRSEDSPMRRIWRSLSFRIPKASNNYDEKLDPLFEFASRKISPLEGAKSSWEQFYPVAKALLVRHHPYSLVTNYQNKYTFHRSIVTAASLVFWLSAIGALVGLVTRWQCGAEPNWRVLLALILGSLAFIGVFSETYLSNWKLFGNTIVTESVAVLRDFEHGNPRKK